MTGRLKVYDADTGTWKYVDSANMPPGVGVYTTAAGATSLNVTQGTAVVVAWGTRFDPYSGYTTSPSPRWVVPAGHDGIYGVTAYCTAAGNTAGQAAGNIRRWTLYKSGVAIASGFNVMASAGVGTACCLAWQGKAVAGDYFEIQFNPLTTNGDGVIFAVGIVKLYANDLG